MGILRVNKVSGLEAPTPVTGSVSFDGSGDALTVPAGTDFAYGTGDFTVESWVYQASSTGFQVLFAQTVGGTNYFVFASNSGVPTFYSTLSGGGNAGAAAGSTISATTWNHIAVTRQSGTVRVFVNGIAGTSVTNTTNLTDTSYVPTIGAYTHGGFANGWNGYISNLRILKGTALYTANFTPPVNELEVIGDTVLLCCKNSSSAAVEATGKTITVNGNAVASTVSPGLTRDFTYGTQFNGVTKFDTQGYFIPPSGTTAQRYVNDIVTSGLVLNLDAGNLNSYPGSGTTWTDLSGNGNNGTLVNGPTYSGANRGSIVFDGTNDNIQLAGTNFSLNTMTISAWNYSSNYIQNGFMFEKTTNGIVNTQYSLFYNGDNTIYYRTKAVSTEDLVVNTTTAGVVNSLWNNVVATFDGTIKRIYVNGILAATSATLSGTITQNTTGSAFIGIFGGGGYPFNGRIAQTQLYNRALTPEEVSQNFNALRGRYGI
jgi:hypothetical protein